MTNEQNKNRTKNISFCDVIAVAPISESLPVLFDFLQQKFNKYSIAENVSEKIQIVTDEIFSNIVKYSGATLSQLAFEINGMEATLVFEDNGIEYDPTKAPQSNSLFVNQTEDGGRGIYMFMRLADNVRYSRCADKNILTLTIKIKE